MILQANSRRETQRSGQAEREANSTDEYTMTSESTGKYSIAPLYVYIFIRYTNAYIRANCYTVDITSIVALLQDLAHTAQTAHQNEWYTSAHRAE